MVESVGGRQYRKREGLGGKESEPSFFLRRGKKIRGLCSNTEKESLRLPGGEGGYGELL